MKQSFSSRSSSFVLLFVLLTITAQGQSSQAIGDWNRSTMQTPMLPGGDVLRPASPGNPWYIGFDVGGTWSTFSNGPVALKNLKNPYNPKAAALRTAIAGDGNGFGFYIGATVDFPVSKIVGIVGKVNFHTRSGSFSSQAREVFSLLPPDTTDIKQDLKWTFNYIGIDLLVRIQIIEKSLYAFVGPSYVSSLSNKVKLDEQLLNPNAFYIEDDGTPFGTTARKLQTLNSETEITGLEKSRFELKAGLGWWIPLDKKLYLTPEVLVGIPLTKLISDQTDPTTGKIVTFDFNMMSLFATIGLRWEM